MKKSLLTPVTLLFLVTSSFAESFPAKEVYEKTSKNVVLITAHCEQSGNSLGAGSIVSNEGLVVTSAHVVIDKKTSEGCSDIKVFLKPDKVTGKSQTDLVNRYYAKIVNYSKDLDIAVLQIDNFSEKLGKIELADPEEIKIGEEVIAIGHPEQGGLWTLTYGRISGEIINQNDIQGKDVYQTDTSVNRGNSGGPLLDRRGYMVGINSNIARLGAGNLPITGVNFALKSSVVKKWIERQGILVPYGKKPLYEEIQSIKPQGEEVKSGVDDEILTPKRPYKIDTLFKEVEKEMEDLMKEMRSKIRKND